MAGSGVLIGIAVMSRCQHPVKVGCKTFGVVQSRPAGWLKCPPTRKIDVSKEAIE